MALLQMFGLIKLGIADKVEVLNLRGEMINQTSFLEEPEANFVFLWRNFISPHGLFYVRVLGRDEEGNVFHRTSPTAISAILPGKISAMRR